MRSVLLCAWAAAVLWPAVALAQSQLLSEAEVLARLSSDSPRVRAFRSTVDVAQADALAARRWPNPRVSFTRESVTGVAEHMTTVTQLLPVTGRRTLEIQVSSALATATSSRADESMRRLRADLRVVFAKLLSAQTREHELVAARDRLQEFAGLLAKREAAGDAAGFDRLRAERELVEVDTDLAFVQTERAQAQAAITGFWANPPDAASIVLVGPATGARTAVPDLESLLRRSESSRGDLQALLRETEAAELSMRVADRRRVPEPEIVAGTKTSNASGGDVGGVFGIHATLPLFDRNRAEHAAAATRGRLAADRASALRDEIKAEVSALRETVLRYREAASGYRARAVEGAAAIERIAQVSYEAGERSILELLDAYRIGSAARVRQAELDAAVRQAEIELEYASGWEMP